MQPHAFSDVAETVPLVMRDKPQILDLLTGFPSGKAPTFDHVRTRKVAWGHRVLGAAIGLSVHPHSVPGFSILDCQSCAAAFG